MSPFIDIHTHRPRGSGVELRTAGIHPWHAAERRVADILPLADDVQAVGEIGLDWACDVAREVQLERFREQLQLAVEYGLPVVLHSVRAFEDVMRCVAGFELRAVIFHGFIGSAEQMRRAVGRGCHLSFGVRSLRSPKTVAALRGMPLDRLFLETDDDPTPIEEVYRRVAEILEMEVDELCRRVAENYENIFVTNG